MGRAEWVDDEDFDVERHYRYVTLDAPGDEAALQAYVSSQTGIPLDPTHPLWEIHFISGFGGGSAAFFRIHHAIADGIALTRVMLSLTDDGPEDSFREVRDPSSTQSLVDAAGWVVVHQHGTRAAPDAHRRTGAHGPARHHTPGAPRDAPDQAEVGAQRHDGGDQARHLDTAHPAGRHQGDRAARGHDGQRRPAGCARRGPGRLPGRARNAAA